MIKYSHSQSYCILMHLSLLITASAAQFDGKVLETELWCVAKNNAEDSALQTAIDWACGPGGTDCAGIQQGGSCYDPPDMLKMASYVFNNYYLKNGPADEACNFSNNAAVTSLNPNCSFMAWWRTRFKVMETASFDHYQTSFTALQNTIILSENKLLISLRTIGEMYEGYVPMAYTDYLKTMKRNGEWGDHVTLQAAADWFGVRMFVITSFKDTCYIEILPHLQKSNRLICLSFWAEVHYNSIYPEGELPIPEGKKKKKYWVF